MWFFSYYEKVDASKYFITNKIVIFLNPQLPKQLKNFHYMNPFKNYYDYFVVCSLCKLLCLASALFWPEAATLTLASILRKRNCSSMLLYLVLFDDESGKLKPTTNFWAQAKIGDS